jgi:uncharacterized protein YecT (DUF1311 family)
MTREFLTMHPHFLFVAALLALVALPAPVTAAELGLAERVLSQPVRPRPKDCENANRLELELCAVAEFRTADAELNKVYQVLMTRDGADEKNRALLRDAQRAFIIYRDKACAWESDLARGGTGATLYAVNCLKDLTEARVASLKENVH